MNHISISSTKAGDTYRELIANHGSPLLVLDARMVRDQYGALRRALPGVDLYYAIKAFPHPAVLNLLADLGAGFDMASSGEIERVRDLRLSARRTLHSHPIKRDQDIRDALRFGCTTFVIDNTDELLKFIPYKHRVGILIRISFRSNAAIVDLSKKFGCTIDDADAILSVAAKLGIHVKGLSFHVGSQCSDANQQAKAIAACNLLIRSHRHTGAAPMSVLDIGGGFPVAYDTRTLDINAYCAPIRKAMSDLPDSVKVIAEPGRFISGPAMSCITTVIGKAVRDGLHWYYLDEGVYGVFSGQIFDHMRYPLEVFSDERQTFSSVLAGPTCDSIDLIAEDIMLPELQMGDLVVGHMMGAYTLATATEFNSLEKTKVIVLNDLHSLTPESPAAGASPLIE